MTKEISLKEKIKGIVNKYDPIKLLEIGAPDDEYNPEIKKILPALQKAISVDQLHNMVYELFVYMFDKDTAGPKKNYRKLSEELYSLK